MTDHVSAEKDYQSGMKYRDIAQKYGVTVNTVKSWKVRYGWQKGNDAAASNKKCAHKEKSMHTKNSMQKAFDDGTKETMQNRELTEQQKLFCIYYSRTFNATQSYLKAYRCKYDVANAEGYKQLVKPCVKAEIERLQEIKRQQVLAATADLVEFHMRIAFADMGDYVTFRKDKVILNNSEGVDTQLIQEVKQTNGGISIKLIDRAKSFEWLEKYFAGNPMDTRKDEYDSFMAALNASAAEVWDDGS